MTVHPISRGTPVELEFAGRHLEGVVEDVRFRPSWGKARSEIVVDADGTRIVTGRASILSR